MELKKAAALCAVAAAVCLLCSCGAAVRPENGGTVSEKKYSVVYLIPTPASEAKETAMKGVWISQFDMHPVFRDGGRQRGERDYTEKVAVMLDNLGNDGFNTLFLQLRPNGDSMYESAIYPTSKYISGVYGGELDYDAVGIFLSLAKERGFAVHAWINPYRLCTKGELASYEGGCVLKDWLGTGRIKEGADGLLYLDPYYKEATALIAAGAKEILEKYDIDGIHIDDYFYPTEFEFDDSSEFAQSGYDSLGDFRRDNVSRTVKALYDTVHSFEGKVFGIAPAGNIYSLSDGWYADIYRWFAEPGFADYIMPQLYFGFKNDYCPFETVLADWEKAASAGNVRLYIGLSAAKCVSGSAGEADKYAGSGKYEWRDGKDILARSIALINAGTASGYCIFCYSSLYDPLTGDVNPDITGERTAFAAVMSG